MGNIIGMVNKKVQQQPGNSKITGFEKFKEKNPDLTSLRTDEKGQSTNPLNNLLSKSIKFETKKQE